MAEITTLTEGTLFDSSFGMMH